MLKEMEALRQQSLETQPSVISDGPCFVVFECAFIEISFFMEQKVMGYCEVLCNVRIIFQKTDWLLCCLEGKNFNILN